MNFLVEIIKGIFVGIANVIPGVSGGTMAVSFGIYDKILSSISNLFKDFKKSVKTLFPIAIGMVLGIVGFTFVIGWLLEHQPFITSMSFTGLILGGLPTIIRELKSGWKRDIRKSLAVNIILLFLFAALAIMLLFLNGDSESDVLLTANAGTMITVFFMGIIAAATMIIPGVSGSLILMILGYYFGIISAVKNFLTALKDFDIKKMWSEALILIPFAIGCLLGVFFLSKLIEWLFMHFASATYCAILGLILASPFSIFYKVQEEYSMAKTGILSIILGIVFFLVCLAVTVFLASIEDKKESENNTGVEENISAK